MQIYCMQDADKFSGNTLHQLTADPVTQVSAHQALQKSEMNLRLLACTSAVLRMTDV